MQSSPHAFHIPVMGTGFTMDSPLRVARFGIDSVVSLGDDMLMERLRQHHSERLGLPFTPIQQDEEDARARRISAWLDFMDLRVREQSLELRSSGLKYGSELWRYYEMLPEGELKAEWRRTLRLANGPKKWAAQASLRHRALPGRIDCNIMTKVDRAFDPDGSPLAPDSTDALSGLRGFAKSGIDATLVFSAGMNPRLYGYITHFDDFFPDAVGRLKKRVCLKVSDWRSAEIQGRFLAKKGIWVSEYRVESGLNCGGHAFAPQGRLLGPILEEFNQKLGSLRAELFESWSKALISKRGSAPASAPVVGLSVQGGVGTAEEQAQLRERYQARSVGWGTPFLLVPEATLVDAEHRRKLCEAGEDDVVLSDASPLGIPFWNLKSSSSEALRRKRVEEGKPGSPCPHAYLIFNTEFGPKPICSSSRQYQRQKLAALEASGMEPEALAEAKRIVTDHACICVDLGGAAQNALGLEDHAPVAICPGPNIAWFDREVSLAEMCAHIYGRKSVLSEAALAARPHMFLSEIKLTVDYMAREWKRSALGLAPKSAEYFEEYRRNLMEGLDYYAERSQEIFHKNREALAEVVSEILAKALPALGLTKAHFAR